MKRFPVIIITLLLILALPFDTFAASKPNQVKKLKATAKTTTSITLRWNKSKTAKAYEVQQYDTKTKKWKTIKKVKTLKYRNIKLKANTTYKYRVRAYSYYKQYFNSKTKKWQNRKPAKKNWKTKKTRTRYLYGKYSKVLTVKTKANKKAASSSNKNTATTSNNKNNSSGSNGNTTGSAGNKPCNHNWYGWYVSEYATRTEKGKEARWCSKCRVHEYRDTPLKPKNPFAMPIDSWIGKDDDDYIIGDKITLTDYRGKTRTFVKVNHWWEEENGYEQLVLTERRQLARYCKDVDGSFTDSYAGGSADYTQKNGVTISIGEIRLSGNDLPGALMYNGDENKLQIVVKNKMETVNSYNYDKEPITATYIMKDGYRLTPYYGIKTERSNNGQYVTKKINVFDTDLLLHKVSCGFVSGDVVADILYDGKKLGEVKYTVNKDADARGLSQGRRDYLDVALAAIKANGGPKDYHTDMRAIENYVKQNYKYGESFGKYASMRCGGGAAVLETYSIYQYKVYGFFGYGGASPNNNPAAYGYHVAFHPDTKPKGCSSYNPPHTYFETEGHR